MPSQSVLVIGGGLAGLSSAVALAEAGARVCLLEKRPHLGGRATSYGLPDGAEVDNCQHVTMECCTNLADFYRRAGASAKIRTHDRLHFADSRGRRAIIRTSGLPSPLHLAPSFARFRLLKARDKLAIARAMLAIARAAGKPAPPPQGPSLADTTMLDWLVQMKQTPAAIARFWRVVLVSALDEELSRMSAAYGIDVFWKAFLRNRSGYRLGIPSVPLADLYDGCQEAIERRGGQVRLRALVRRVCVEHEKFSAAVLDRGEKVSADACIIATPHQAALSLLPEETSGPGGPLASLRELRTSPITGVHLWFDRPVMHEPFLALLDSTTQWIFNKTALSGAISADAKSAGQYLQLVISASYDLVERSRQDILETCLRDLAAVLPGAREAKLLKSTVVKEVHATFSPAPGVDRHRPPQCTQTANLFLAGDWTRTGWPATMEGAVRSGYLAAEAVLKSWGQPQTFIQPDLPSEGWCRSWERKASAQPRNEVS